jgi:hypothetical protein
MKILISTSVGTGIALILLFIYSIWFETSYLLGKIFLTLGILFVAQIIGYLVLRDINEESTGKEDGTIAC